MSSTYSYWCKVAAAQLQAFPGKLGFPKKQRSFQMLISREKQHYFGHYRHVMTIGEVLRQRETSQVWTLPFSSALSFSEQTEAGGVVPMARRCLSAGERYCRVLGNWPSILAVDQWTKSLPSWNCWGGRGVCPPVFCGCGKGLRLCSQGSLWRVL